MPDAPAGLSNALIDRYAIERELGAGGMARRRGAAEGSGGQRGQ